VPLFPPDCFIVYQITIIKINVYLQCSILRCVNCPISLQMAQNLSRFLRYKICHITVSGLAKDRCRENASNAQDINWWLTALLTLGLQPYFWPLLAPSTTDFIH